VALFDVNHNYGLFFVESRKLYSAVDTTDVFANTHRALVITEIMEDNHLPAQQKESSQF
jgi:hypothetical protein